MRSITAADAGRQVALRVGEPCDVALVGNPTTGYYWEVAKLNTSIVKQLGDAAYEPAGSASGAGGRFTFHFQAVGLGQTPVQLVYRRSFEKNAPPAQTFEIQVVVK